MKKKLVAVAALAAVSLTACGGGGRPSQDEISKAMKEQISKMSGGAALTDDQLDCFAKALEESDLSDDTLNKMVDGKDGSSDETSQATEVMTSAATDCIMPAS
jgi:hypothetical protein